IQMNSIAYTVVGIMPARFRTFDFGTDLWIPLTVDRSDVTWAGANGLGYGLLRAGVTPQAATVELGTLARNMRENFQLASDWPLGASVVGLQESLVGSLRPTVLVLAFAVGFLL